MDCSVNTESETQIQRHQSREKKRNSDAKLLTGNQRTDKYWEMKHV